MILEEIIMQLQKVFKIYIYFLCALFATTFKMKCNTLGVHEKFCTFSPAPSICAMGNSQLCQKLLQNTLIAYKKARLTFLSRSKVKMVRWDSYVTLSALIFQDPNQGPMLGEIRTIMDVLKSTLTDIYLWKHNSSYTKKPKLDATKHKLSENKPRLCL